MVTEPRILPLRLNSVSVRKNGKTILDDVSIQFDVSEFSVIMGPNGSGKTTLLRLMHGLEKPQKGDVSWASPHNEIRNKQSFVFQTPIMLRRSVLNNLIYPLKVIGMSKAQVQQKADNWLADMSMTDKAAISAHQLSGGEKQKLAVARALIANPQVLFLDEPTTNLDGVSTREIESLLKSAENSGTRIIMTTHDIGQAKRLASEIIFMHQGMILESAKAAEFFDNPKSLEARAYLRGDIVE